jgi:hypothetical protein
MEKPAFTRVNLFDVRLILTIMRVPVVELLYQVAMRWISVLKCLLSGARGCLWSCPIVPGIKYYRFSRIRLQQLFSIPESP